ncbi:hypothetical protein NEOLEDRAFT_906394 [Neolentinus lepideus HHB14362 ss-1]|uniref:Uncharacterized protein n=1 Tax=Neolentinus lepideus HHB14362 ss-1 TaxID=1314782 RepID=A0A165UIW4_9AGAM|nr:hypothetical protein NEOLEDRAFT_906394 [Neolentinus lepideus HHB14362 ss-1]
MKVKRLGSPQMLSTVLALIFNSSYNFGVSHSNKSKHSPLHATSLDKRTLSLDVHLTGLTAFRVLRKNLSR